MRLNKVTLTGADDTVDQNELFELASKYPFVEWGILVSKSSMGSHRFPSFNWLHELQQNPHIYPNSTDKYMNNFSFHFCGKWVRDICSGYWYDIDPIIKQLIEGLRARVQLNFHSYLHLINEHFFHQLRNNIPTSVIFQVDGKNDHLVKEAHQAGIAAVPLYDKSGGNGIVPDYWPKQDKGVYTGYAGGLGPNNIREELSKIFEVCDTEMDQNIWIDMESKLYTGTKFDLDKCEKVLQICSDYVKKEK